MALEKLETNIVLDVYDHDGPKPSIKSIALDDNTRYVFARLTYKGATYDIGKDATVKLIIIRPDKVGAQIVGEAKEIRGWDDESIIAVYGPYAELDQPAIAVAGTLLGQFVITSGDQILRSQIFTDNNGEALNSKEWAGQYDGYNLDELVEKVDNAAAKVDGMEADVSELKSGFSGIDRVVFGGESKTALSFPMNTQAWSQAEYSFSSGVEYTVSLEESYGLATNGVYIRLYRGDGTYVQPVSGKIYEPITFTPTENFVALGLGRGYTPSSPVTAYVSYSTGENSLVGWKNATTEWMNGIDEWKGQYSESLDVVFAPSGGFKVVPATLKKGTAYTLLLPTCWNAESGRIIIRYYLADRTTNYQSKTFYAETEFPYTFVADYDYSYIGMATPGVTRTENITITVNSDDLSDAVSTSQKLSFINAKVEEESVPVSYPVADGDNVLNTMEYRDYIKFQFQSVFGGETLASYHNKLNGRKRVKIVLDGDSITQEGYRNEVIKSIMSAGGYMVEDATGALIDNYTLYNNGQGGATTKEWVGTGTSYIFNGRTIPANGMLSDAMAQNPDLLMIAFGTNDAMADGATVQARVETYLVNMEEGLKRIRTNASVNGRPAYNKKVEDLGLILCNAPMSTFGGNRANIKWQVFVRKSLMNLARTYGCAFVDFAMPTYGINVYNSLNIWGDYGVSDASIHPGRAFTKYYASILQPLFLPFGFWKETSYQSIPKSGVTADRPKSALIPIGYQYYCTDTHKPIFCSSIGSLTKATFTVGSISTISDISAGDFRLRAGNANAYVYLLSLIINRVGTDYTSNLSEGFAKLISGILNALGFMSDYDGNTFTLYAKTRTDSTTVSFTDNIERGATGLPISGVITETGSYNSFSDINGNDVS